MLRAYPAGERKEGGVWFGLGWGALGKIAAWQSMWWVMVGDGDDGGGGGVCALNTLQRSGVWPKAAVSGNAAVISPRPFYLVSVPITPYHMVVSWVRHSPTGFVMRWAQSHEKKNQRRDRRSFSVPLLTRQQAGAKDGVRWFCGVLCMHAESSFFFMPSRGCLLCSCLVCELVLGQGQVKKRRETICRGLVGKGGAVFSVSVLLPLIFIFLVNG